MGSINYNDGVQIEKMRRTDRQTLGDGL